MKAYLNTSTTEGPKCTGLLKSDCMYLHVSHDHTYVIPSPTCTSGGVPPAPPVFQVTELSMGELLLHSPVAWLNPFLSLGKARKDLELTVFGK